MKTGTQKIFEHTQLAAHALIEEANPRHAALFYDALDKAIDEIWRRLEATEGCEIIMGEVVLALVRHMVELVAGSIGTTSERLIMLSAANFIGMQLMVQQSEGNEENDERVTH